MYLLKTPCNEVFVSSEQAEEEARKDFYAHHEDFLDPSIQWVERLNEQLQVGRKVLIVATDDPSSGKVGAIITIDYGRERDYYEVDAHTSFPLQDEFNRTCFFCAYELQPVPHDEGEA